MKTYSLPRAHSPKSLRWKKIFVYHIHWFSWSLCSKDWCQESDWCQTLFTATSPLSLIHSLNFDYHGLFLSTQFLFLNSKSSYWTAHQNSCWDVFMGTSYLKLNSFLLCSPLVKLLAILVKNFTIITENHLRLLTP